MQEGLAVVLTSSVMLSAADVIHNLNVHHSTEGVGGGSVFILDCIQHKCFSID